MSNNAMRVGYRLVRNGTSTADRAPYLGVAVPVGSLAYDNILTRMLERGTHMTRATAQYFLNAFYEYAAEAIADDVVRINMGAVSIYPMIGGSFDSEDDEFRAPRNTLYVGATLSQEIRDAVSGIVPANLGEGPAKGTVKISSVMDLASETYRLIDGLKEFRIVGIDLTVPDGEDESLSLVAADGLTKVADITVVSTEDGQRITCRLATAVSAGTYYVRLVSHGLDPTAPLVTALHKVSVKAAPPPVPEPIWESDDGQVKVMSAADSETGDTFTWGNAWNVLGEGFTGTEAGWYVEVVMLEPTPGAEFVPVNFRVKSATEVEITAIEGAEIAAGDYPNASITFGIAHDSEEGLVTDAAHIPIHLVVSE